MEFERKRAKRERNGLERTKIKQVGEKRRASFKEKQPSSLHARRLKWHLR